MASTPIDMAPFRHLYPFTSRFVDVNGFRMHYVDEGRGEPVVMLHGNPTWSFYYRALIQGLCGSCRTVAPDHIGCGLSARPGAGEYGFRLQNRIDDLEVFMGRLGIGNNITLVLHDWGGIIGAGFAVRHPECIGRLVILNTAAFLKPKTKPLPTVLKAVRNLPRLARPAVLGLNLFARGAVWTASARGLTPAVRAGLLAPYNSWRNRLATLRFVQDIPLKPEDPSFALAQEIDQRLSLLSEKQMLICWGDKDFVFDRDYLAEWRRRFPQAAVHHFPEAGHYILEDAPEKVLNALRNFLKCQAGRG
jgi:cis-3-alkyl-4-acyloxetan-2-one decarboxylase